MAGISNYLADPINDWLHGGSAAYTPSGTTYFALMTVMPTGAGGGTEVSGGSYARVAVTNNSTNWPASTSGVKANGTAITFPTATADWGLIVGIAEYSASTSGNLLTFAPLATSRSVLNGQVFSLAIGNVTFTWTGISQYLANKLNDWLHGGGVYTMPGTTYLGLMTTAPTESTPGTETTGGGYARVTDTNNLTDWPASSGGAKANGNTLTWGPATGAWSATEVAVAEYDAASSGNILTFGNLSPNITVASGQSPTVPISGATYTVS
jgi:hypothetical protein